MRRLVMGLLLMALVPATASAAGGPVGAVFGVGATRPGDPSVYFASPDRGRTLLQQIEGDRAVAYRTIPGEYGIAGAAFDLSTTGLSADGSTLVLTDVSGSRTRTRLLPIDARRSLRPGRPIVLPGYFTIDAISPDGATLYLIHYRRPNADIADYEVRAYDLRARRLLPGAIVDAREPDEKMTGVPLTRVMSADGRVAYTLYDAKEPFVHALDTATGTAHCIDLAPFTTADVGSVPMALVGTTLRIGTSTSVDLRSLVVSYGPARTAVAAPAVAAAAPTPVAATTDEARSFPAARLAAPAALALLVAGALLHRRRRRPLAVDGD
jgi:hypothetical protein